MKPPKSREEMAGEMYRDAVKEVYNGAHNIEMLAMHIQQMLTGIQKYPGALWRERLVPPEGKRVTLDRFEDYLLRPAREGLAFKSLHQVDTMLKAAGKTGTKALAALRAEIAGWDEQVNAGRVKVQGKEAPKEVGPGQGTRTDLDEHRDHVTKLTRGTNGATYLAARIKRDAPEIAARVEKGEFKSMRSAAKAAGIIRDKTRLEKIQSLYSGAAADEKAAIREWVSQQLN